MNQDRRIGLLGASLLLLTACTPSEGIQVADIGIDSILAADIGRQIAVLASDEFEGRRPSSPGEVKTVNYLAEQFKQFGLAPGNGDSYFQEVPLVDITASAAQTLIIQGKQEPIKLAYGSDYVAVTRRVVDEINIDDSDLVFVGYGIVAPEYNWNDYAGIDMQGKTAIILVNDPGYATKNDDLFTGFAMTYYGRWTYKYDEAMRQGADAAIIIHENGAAGYPWSVVEGGWSGTNFSLESTVGEVQAAKMEGWVSADVAVRIFEMAGLDLETLSHEATKQGFRAVPMNLNASVSFTNEINHSLSKNVVGIVPGSDKAEEYFLYIAHWDHFGIDPDLPGDNIFNGAHDNASGTAALLELAQAWGSLTTPPPRTMIFLAVTAEEQGLLGSQHYGENPIFALNKTIAGLNMDGLNLIGKTRDIVVTGFGLSELDEYLSAAAAAQGRVLAPDPSPEKGYYYRSDHFNLAKQGVPMIYPSGGHDHQVHGSEYGDAMASDYVANRYHKVSDEYDPDWDLSGAEQDVRLFYQVAEKVVQGEVWPNWRPGTEFRAIRDASLNHSDL